MLLNNLELLLEYDAFALGSHIVSSVFRSMQPIIACSVIPILNPYFLPGTPAILSFTFDAELAVGLIMRSRNEAGAAATGDLGAGVGAERAFCGGFCGRLEALLIVDARRLSVRCDGGESPCLADEDAVGATR